MFSKLSQNELQLWTYTTAKTIKVCHLWMVTASFNGDFDNPPASFNAINCSDSCNFLRIHMATTPRITPDKNGADGIAAGALIFLCFAFPAMGLLSDIYKTRRKVMLCGGIAVVLLSIPLFAALVHANSSPGLSFLALCIF
eukprot:gene30524-9003_t